jgi:hypothetical protein
VISFIRRSLLIARWIITDQLQQITAVVAVPILALTQPVRAPLLMSDKLALIGIGE